MALCHLNQRRPTQFEMRAGAGTSVANTSDDDEDNGAGQRGSQRLDERSQLFELLKAVEAGHASPDRVKRRLLMLYHWDIGSVMKMLAEIDKSAAREVAEGLRRSIDGLLGELDPPPAARKKEGPTVGDLLANKSRKSILLREYDILRLLGKSNLERQARELLELVRKREPNLKAEALTAHLDRMLADDIIARPHKGLYRAGPLGEAYLEALEQLMERLGYLPAR